MPDKTACVLLLTDCALKKPLTKSIIAECGEGCFSVSHGFSDSHSDTSNGAVEGCTTRHTKLQRVMCHKRIIQPNSRVVRVHTA